MSWRIRIDHSDLAVSVDYTYDDDELEFGVDDALHDARNTEQNLSS